MNVDERRRKSDFAPAQRMGLKDGDNSGVTGGGLSAFNPPRPHEGGVPRPTPSADLIP